VVVVASLCHRDCAAKQQQAAAAAHLRRVREAGVLLPAAATCPRQGAVAMVMPGAGGRALAGSNVVCLGWLGLGGFAGSGRV
jgi:hypothetical protein